MNEESIYKKGMKVWVQIPVAGAPGRARPAEIISPVKNGQPFGNKTHILVRYLDEEGVGSYKCIPNDWIIEIPE